MRKRKAESEAPAKEARPRPHRKKPVPPMPPPPAPPLPPPPLAPEEEEKRLLREAFATAEALALDGSRLPSCDPEQAIVAVSIWKRHLGHAWISVPPDWHTCGQTQGCELDQLRVRFYLHDPEASALSAEFPPPPPPSQEPHFSRLFHVCLPGACRLDAAHPCHQGQGVARLTDRHAIREGDLYVCQHTGLWHLCGRHCRLRMYGSGAAGAGPEAKGAYARAARHVTAVSGAGAGSTPGTYNRDGTSVCPLSGRLAGDSLGLAGPEVRMVSAFWAPHVGNSTRFSSVSNRLSNPWNERYESKHGRNLRDNRGLDSRALEAVHGSQSATPEEAYKKHHAALARPSNMQRAVNAGRLSEHEGLATKVRVLQQLEDKLRNLFSVTRMQAELKGNREIDAEIMLHLGRYAHRKSVQATSGGMHDTLVQAQDMELLAEDCRVKHPAFPVVRLSPDTRQEICKYLAMECLKLWVIIVTRTRQGRECPQDFEMRDFLEPALQLFQEGFYVSRAELDTDVQIIKPHRVLLEIPVTTPVASCFLRSGKVDEEVFRDANKTNGNKTSNELKKRIHAAFLEEVLERGTAPELLRPDSIQFDAIDDRVFELVHQAKRCGAGAGRGGPQHAYVIKQLEQLDLTGAAQSVGGETPGTGASSYDGVKRASRPSRPLSTSAEVMRAEDEATLRCWQAVGPPEFFLFRYTPPPRAATDDPENENAPLGSRK